MAGTFSSIGNKGNTMKTEHNLPIEEFRSWPLVTLLTGAERGERSIEKSASTSRRGRTSTTLYRTTPSFRRSSTSNDRRSTTQASSGMSPAMTTITRRSPSDSEKWGNPSGMKAYPCCGFRERKSGGTNSEMFTRLPTCSRAAFSD